MTIPNPDPQPFQPSFISRLLLWIRKRKLPRWVLYMAITLIIGAIQTYAAFQAGLLPAGSVELNVALPGLFIVAMLWIGDVMLFSAGRALDQLRPILGIEEGEFLRIKYSFTIIPATSGTLLAIAGLALGFLFGYIDMGKASAAAYAWPAFRIAIWMFSNVFVLPLTYQGLRQVLMTRQLYAMANNIDIFKLEPVYSMPRYTVTLGIIIFAAAIGLPYVVNPTAFNTQVLIGETYFFLALILFAFFYPLVGVNRRIVAEKEHLIDNVNTHIEDIFTQINEASKKKQHELSGQLGETLQNLLKEREILEAIRTWPWRPGTLAGLVSTLLLPLFLSLLQSIFSRLLGN